jgi:hypothetical protein
VIGRVTVEASFQHALFRFVNTDTRHASTKPSSRPSRAYLLHFIATMRLLIGCIVALAIMALPVTAHPASGASRSACHHIVSGKKLRCTAAPSHRPTVSLYRRLMLAGFPKTRIASDAAHVPSWRWPEVPLLLDGFKIRPIDGDTFAYGAQRIRIRGIDAPEVSESGGFEASERIDLLLREGPVMIIPRALDKYGRIVADVFVGESNVAEALSSEGYTKPK